MFWHQGAIIRQSVSDKILQVQQVCQAPFALTSIKKPYDVKTPDYSSTIPVHTAATAACTVTQTQLFILPGSARFETFKFYHGSKGECHLKYLLDLWNFFVDKTA